MDSEREAFNSISEGDLVHLRLLGPVESYTLQNLNCDIETSSLSMFSEEILTISSYGIRILGPQFLEFCFSLVPIIFISHLSTNALAAVNLASTIADLSGESILSGLSCALDTLLPTTWASSHPQLMGLWAQRMYVVLSIALIPIFWFWFNIRQVLVIFRQDPEVAMLAGIYLRCASLELPAYCFNLISRRYFQSQGLFTLQTWIICCVLPIQLLMTYTLVLGPEHIGLGFLGAPISATISSALVSILSIICGIFWVPRTGWHPISRESFTDLGVVVQLGLTGAAQKLPQEWVWAIFSLVSSFLGSIAGACNLILTTSFSVHYQLVSALADATSIRLGNLLGQRNPRRAKIAAIASITLSAVNGCFLCTLLMIFRPFWAEVFNDDPEIVKTVTTVIPLVALLLIVDGISSVIAVILRTKGDQWIGAVFNFCAFGPIGLPIGLYLTLGTNLGLPGLWTGLIVATLLYGVAMGTYLWLTTDWDREVKKVLIRVEELRVQVSRGDKSMKFVAPGGL